MILVQVCENDRVDPVDPAALQIGCSAVSRVVIGIAGAAAVDQHCVLSAHHGNALSLPDVDCRDCPLCRGIIQRERGVGYDETDDRRHERNNQPQARLELENKDRSDGEIEKNDPGRADPSRQIDRGKADRGDQPADEKEVSDQKGYKENQELSEDRKSVV